MQNYLSNTSITRLSPRRLLPRMLLCSLMFSCGAAGADTAIYDFSSLPSGSAYVVGDTVDTEGGMIELIGFQWTDGTWTNTGVATVESSTNAAGSVSQELNLDNIMVRVIPDVPAISASFLYADFGGNVNLGVNGQLRNVNDLIDLNGAVVGGCIINVSKVKVPGGRRGAVTIVPQAGTTISRFAVGGQEFYVDDVQHNW